MSGYALWNPSTTYNVNDVVDYNAAIWVSLVGSNTNNPPSTSPSRWSQIGGSGSLTNIVGGSGITVSGTGNTRTVSVAPTIAVDTINLPAGSSQININSDSFYAKNAAATKNLFSARQLTPTTTTTYFGDSSLVNSVYVNGTSGSGLVYDTIYNKPVALDGVRYNSTQSLTLTPLTVIGYNPYTLFTINLPAAFAGCNVFTFYVRDIAFVATTPSIPAVSLQMYPSDTLGTNTAGVGAWDSNEGAMSKYEWTGVINGQGYGASNLVWNWRPSSINLVSPVIYINAFLTSSTQTVGTNGLQITLDIVGQKMTLV